MVNILFVCYKGSSIYIYIKYSEKVKYDYHKLDDFTESDLQEFKQILIDEKYDDEELEKIRKGVIQNLS